MLPAIANSTVGVGGGATGGDGDYVIVGEEDRASPGDPPDWNLSPDRGVAGAHRLRSTSHVRGQDGETQNSFHCTASK